jgi:hypothetical protein
VYVRGLSKRYNPTDESTEQGAPEEQFLSGKQRLHASVAAEGNVEVFNGIPKKKEYTLVTRLDIYQMPDPTPR